MKLTIELEQPDGRKPIKADVMIDDTILSQVVMPKDKFIALELGSVVSWMLEEQENTQKESQQ